MIRVEGPEWEIIRLLNILPVRNIDLSKQLKVSPAMISKSISGMEAGGLVKRDGKLFELTKTGKWYAEFYKKVKKNRTG